MQNNTQTLALVAAFASYSSLAAAGYTAPRIVLSEEYAGTVQVDVSGSNGNHLLEDTMLQPSRLQRLRVAMAMLLLAARPMPASNCRVLDAAAVVWRSSAHASGARAVSRGNP